MNTKIRIRRSPFVKHIVERYQRFIYPISQNFLGFLLDMEISSEEANFVKISKAIVDFIPKYLLTCFIKIWNEKYQNRKWQSDKESGEFLVSELPDSIKNDKRNRRYIDNLKNLSEKQWDTTTLVFAMLYSGLSLTEPCRRQDQRTEPLRISEAIDVIRKARNTYFAHAERMACPSDEFERVMKDIKNAARYLADDAEREIEELIKSQIKMMTEEQMKQVREEESRQPDLEIFLSICNGKLSQKCTSVLHFIQCGKISVLQVYFNFHWGINKLIFLHKNMI